MFFSPLLLGFFNGFSADGDRVTDRLLDGLTDEANEVQIEGNFARNWTFGKFHPAILVGILTMNLADVSTDGTDDGLMDILMDRWSSRWNHIWVGKQMSHVTDIWMDLSCY